jgi:hypothetical protein
MIGQERDRFAMQETMSSAKSLSQVPVAQLFKLCGHRLESLCRGFVFAAMFLCGTLGCSQPAGTYYDAGQAVKNESLAQGLRAGMRKTYPRAFHASARCIMTRSQGQFAFNGHVLVRGADEMQVLASTDFGSKILEVSSSRPGGAVVVCNHSDWSDAVLIECALRDVTTIYAKQPPAKAAVIRHADGSEGLCWQTDKCREEFQFDRGTGRLHRYVKARGDRVVYEAVFSDYVTDARWGGSVPHDIAVSDQDCRYSLNVHVLKLDPIAGGGPVPDGE